MKIAYRLTKENYSFPSYFEGVTIDEERQILWSEQNLTFLGCQPVSCQPVNLEQDIEPLGAVLSLSVFSVPETPKEWVTFFLKAVSGVFLEVKWKIKWKLRKVVMIR